MSRSYSKHLWTMPLLLVAPLALATASCGEAPLPTAAASRASGAAERPEVRRPMRITAGVELVNEVVPPPDPCLQLSESVIEGHATHLGRFEGVGSTCILDVVAPDPDPPFPAPGPPPYLTATFSNPRWVLTAANGDELWLEAARAVAVISLVDNSLRARGLDPQLIVGGTGRFEGATGELWPRAVNEDGQPPDDFESRGWIQYRSGR